MLVSMGHILQGKLTLDGVKSSFINQVKSLGVIMDPASWIMDPALVPLLHALRTTHEPHFMQNRVACLFSSVEISS